MSVNPSVHLLIVSRSKILPSSAYGTPTTAHLVAALNFIYYLSLKAERRDAKMRLHQVPSGISSRIVMERCRGP